MSSRFLLIAAMIVVPVLGLAGGAAWGLKAQERAMRAEALEWAQREARAVLAALEDRWTNEARQHWVRLYEAVPPPAEPAQVSPAFDTFGRNRQEAAEETLLREAATGTSAFGLTPAGLPLGPLAALAHLEEAPEAERARRLAVLAVHFAPSAVTPLILERAEELMRDQRGEIPPILANWRETWKELEGRRAAVREQSVLVKWTGAETVAPPALASVTASLSAHEPFRSASGYWVLPFPEPPTPFLSLTREGETREVPASGEVFGVLSVAETKGVAESLRRERETRLPEWAALTLWWPDEESFLPSSMPHREIIAAEKHPAWLITAAIVEKSPGVRLVGHRQWAKWAWSLVGGAVGCAALGLSLAWRMLARERRLGELKSQFVSSVSHELRAPVGSLRLMAEGLASGKIVGEGAITFHRLMAREGARLSSLIENVLDFARIEQGRKHYVLAETDLPALVRESVQLMQPLAEARHLTISLQLPPTPFTPSVDAGALQQALINVLDNAIKFSPPGGEVCIQLTASSESSTADANGTWSVSVRDHGPGIQLAEQERIFERFYRLGNELRRETQGAGIGLSLVKHITEGHGGRVEVISAPGKGCEMKLVFHQQC